ncbi:MAG: ABC transporter permease, partial [Candidatus Hodarchaeota archaeon]
IMGVHLKFIEGFSPGYGYEGIAVSLLGNNNPLAVLSSAIFFGALKNGGLAMDAGTGVPREMIVVLQAVIIFFVASRGIFRFLLRFSRLGG